MLSILIVACAAAGLATVEIARLLKRKRFKEIGAFSFFLLVGLTLSVLAILDVPVPNPTDWIRTLFTPVSQTIDELLELKSK